MARTIMFEITAEIAVEDGCGAQPVLGNNQELAKIFDPLYYPWQDGSAQAYDDVTLMADCDYTREAAAYNELNDKFGGSIIPKFFGSWTCDVSTPTPSGLKVRPVRLVLLEFLQGTSLLHLEPTHFSEQDRINLDARAMESATRINHGGVLHMDFSPRNIIVSGQDDDEPMESSPRVTIVDFNVSIVRRLADPESGCRMEPSKLPQSPLSQFWKYASDFVDTSWLPENYD
jgi:hypothetical protein